MADGGGQVSKPAVAKTGTLTLKSILEAFNAPLNEEQAWAVCYQSVKCSVEDILSGGNRICCGLETINVEKDGSVRVKSGNLLTLNSAEKTSTESQFIKSLGVVIYGALDYGVGESEERHLSNSLEDLIERMTAGEDDDSQTGDEGFENDLEGLSVTTTEVLELCSNHLQRREDAPDHYRAVCRALVTEALELLTFLEKISTSKECLQPADGIDFDADLKDLCRIDWARLWMQVLQSLRQGVKLKTVERVNLCPLEFELTPYEILMEDIRMRRYTLNKIMVDGKIPVSMALKNDAHSVILDFIRSRPPLQPASERKLRSPPPKSPILHEQLLEAIKGEHKLKKTPVKFVETSRTKLCESDSTPAPTRKVIKPDFSLLLNSFDDDSEDDFDDIDIGLYSPEVTRSLTRISPTVLAPLSPLSPKGYKPGDYSEEVPPETTWQKAVALDLLMASPSSSGRKLERRHSITVCESPVKSSKVEELEDDPFYPAAFVSLPHAPPHELSQGAVSSVVPSSNNGSSRVREHRTKPTRSRSDLSHLSRAELHKRWQHPIECLSLTVEEVMHIRSVLTKAELESLLVNPTLYSLVARAKVCFTCKKTRFALFGPWGTKCKFCRRKVCQRCIKKMRIPTDHFENIPVYTLSPSPLSPKTSEEIYTKESTGSVPSSPNMERKNKAKNYVANNNCDNSELQGSKVKLEGPIMNICRDCKSLVLNVIRASRTTIALAQTSSLENITPTPAGITPPKKPPRNFHLDLKSVY